MQLSPLHKRYFLATSLFLAFSYIIAQPQLLLDSLQANLQAAPARSTEKAKALLSLSDFYRSNAPVESIFYAKELLKLAKVIKSDEYIYLGHMATGVAYAIEGISIDKALQHFLDGLELANTKTGDDWTLRQIKANINIAGIHYTNGNIPKALDYSYIYVQKLEAIQDSSTLAASYETVALMHQKAENWDSVFHYLDKAIMLYQHTRQQHRLMEARLIEAEVRSSMGAHEAALSIFTELLSQAQAYKDSTLLVDLYPSLSNAYLKSGDVENAKYYVFLGLDALNGRSLTSKEAEHYNTLYNIFYTTQQFDSALFYFQAYAEAKEKMLNEEKAKAAEEMEARFQLKERGRENERLKATVKAKNFQNALLLLSSLLFLCLMLAIVFFYSRLRKRKAELESLNLEVFEINTQLLSLINEKKHMVSLIAHDIRNPLSLIQLNTHTLAAEDSSLKATERDKMLEEIEAATAAIDQASLKIMEIENNSEEAVVIQTSNFDLTPELLNARKEFLPYANSKNIELNLELPDDKYFIKGDPFLFKHIISNLISNAIKYSARGSKVTLALKNTNEDISISIADQGPGLPIEDQEKIFLQGATTPNAPTAGERKLGKGLYLTRRYVEAMNGIIKVNSTVGEGTVFTILFPKVGN